MEQIFSVAYKGGIINGSGVTIIKIGTDRYGLKLNPRNIFSA